jgi:hypothetical protein
VSQCPSTSIHHKLRRISSRYQQVQACTSRLPDSADGVLGRQRRTVFGEGGRAGAKNSSSARRGNAYFRHAQTISATGQRRRYLTDLCSCIDLLYFIFLPHPPPSLITVTPTYTAISDTLSLSLYVQLRALCGRSESDVERSTKAA